MTSNDEPRRRLTWQWVVIVPLAAIVAGAAVYLVWRSKPQPLELVTATVAKYADVSAARGEGALSVSLDAQGRSPTEWKFKFAYRLPRESRIELNPGASDETLVVTAGDYVYTYYPGEKYGRRDAAPDELIRPLAAALSASDLKALRLPLGTGPLLQHRVNTEGIQEAKLIEKETQDGRDSYHIHLVYDDGFEQDLYIGVKDSLLWKAVTQAALADALEASGLRRDDPTVKAAREQRLMLRVTERLTNIELDPELGPEVFAFDAPPDALIARVLTGEAAPDFAAYDLQGERVRLSELRGAPVVIDFWATWCVPCLQVMPILDRLQRQYAERGLVVLGLNTDESASRIVNFFDRERLSVSFRILYMREGEGKETARAYGIDAIPRTLFIDADGVVRADLVGAHSEDDYVQALAKVGIE